MDQALGNIFQKLKFMVVDMKKGEYMENITAKGKIGSQS